jgi:3-deoxy-D-manno-octulosonate 8-phosphate phosphatase (KDO 8-P phosphatase)
MNLIKDFRDFKEVQSAFTSVGGRFVLPAEVIKSKLSEIKAFVFDWDGVFNDATKGEGTQSLFSEIDSAGLNLLRYAYYRMTKSLPVFSIITGEENPTALQFSKREGFNLVFTKVLNKIEAVNHLCRRNNIATSQVACIFDDINDLSMARMCGLRFMINKSSNPAFQSVVVNNGWCDYITGNEQPNYPLREICELIMAFSGRYEESLLSRVNLDDTYKKFLEQKKSVVSHFVKAANVGFQEEPMEK